MEFHSVIWRQERKVLVILHCLSGGSVVWANWCLTRPEFRHLCGSPVCERLPSASHVTACLACYCWYIWPQTFTFLLMSWIMSDDWDTETNVYYFKEKKQTNGWLLLLMKRRNCLVHLQPLRQCSFLLACDLTVIVYERHTCCFAISGVCVCTCIWKPNSSGWQKRQKAFLYVLHSNISAVGKFPTKSWTRKEEVKLKTDHNQLRDCKLQNLCPVGNAAVPVQVAFGLKYRKKYFQVIIGLF